MNPFHWLLDTVIEIAVFFIIAQFILSWLVVFGIVNLYQPLVAQIHNFLGAITEPLYRPVRQFIPSVGGFDLSPMIVLLGLQFLRMLLWDLFSGF